MTKDGTASPGPGVPEDSLNLDRLNILFSSRYAVLGKIDEGGMAAVFLARQLNLDRPVALKVLLPCHYHDEGLVKRFSSEAQTAAMFRHPNIVTVYDEGTENGLHYIAMEFIDGQDLCNVLHQRRALPPGEAVRIVLHILDALEYMHAQRNHPVHRDIKSSNILVEKESGRIVLTDFGIAQGKRDSADQSGEILGTPEYMSPEQTDSANVDARSDLYSTAVVLFELLYGVVPFKGSTMRDTIRMVCETDPVGRFPEGDPLPAPLRGLLCRALAKSPDQRFQTAAEFKAALKSLQLEPGSGATLKIIMAAILVIVVALAGTIAFLSLNKGSQEFSAASEGMLEPPPAPDGPGQPPAAPPGAAAYNPVFTVAASPAGSKVEFLTPPMPYFPGMTVPSGEYRIQVSHQGYVTRTLTLLVTERNHVETVALERAPAPGAVWRHPQLDMDFVWVPGSCYSIGCGPWDGDCGKDDLQLRSVCLDGFWIGRYEVNQAQWSRIMGSNESKFQGNGDRPVEQVSWQDAQRFIQAANALGGKTVALPSEEQWEYACRSGGKEEVYSGANTPEGVAVFSGNALGHGTAPVGSKAPNGLGIHDMSGNVWEWTGTAFDQGAGAQAAGAGTDSVPLMVVRGGAWSNPARMARCACRYKAATDKRLPFLGLRLVCLP